MWGEAFLPLGSGGRGGNKNFPVQLSKGLRPLSFLQGGAAGKCVLAKFHWISDICAETNYRYKVFARSTHSLYFAELEMTDQWYILQEIALLRITSLAILGEDCTEKIYA